MAHETKSLAEQYYEAVEGLKQGGMSNAEAIRKVAADFGKEENAIRGGTHQYKKKLEGGGTASSGGRGRRKAVATVEDHLASARRSLEEALHLVDREVDQAKQALDAAQARYDEVTASVKDRKTDIEKKLKALVS